MKFAFITTCMGRLAHVKQSSTALLKDPRINGVHNFYVLVDFACPDKTGQWVEETYGSRANVVHLRFELPKDQEVLFQKTVALNQGALRAKALGTDYLVFLDADCVVKTPSFVAFLQRHASYDHFMVMLPDRANRDLCGFLGTPLAAFEKAGGFDQRMIGWGAEDLDMRLKLLLKAKLQWTEVPCTLAESLQHSDDLRTRFSPFVDKQDSNQHNVRILDSNVHLATGLTCRQLFDTPMGRAVRTMLGLPPELVGLSHPVQ